MAPEEFVSTEDAALEAEIFSKVDRFDWADEQMECLDIDATDCLSKLLLERSSSNSSALPTLGRTGSTRHRRRGRGGGRKSSAVQQETGKGDRNQKRQPSEHGHGAKREPEKKSGKEKTKHSMNDGGNPWRRNTEGRESCGGQLKGDPKTAPRHQRQRKRSSSAKNSVPAQQRGAVLSPRGSQADVSSDWNADKLSNCGSSTHRSTCSNSSGSIFQSPRMSRGSRKAGRRRARHSDASNTRGGRVVSSGENQSRGTNGAAKTCHAEHMENWRRGGDTPLGREPFATHDRCFCTAATSAC